jgi:hypothetical protein
LWRKRARQNEATFKILPCPVLIMDGRNNWVRCAKARTFGWSCPVRRAHRRTVRSLL